MSGINRFRGAHHQNTNILWSDRDTCSGPIEAHTYPLKSRYKSDSKLDSIALLFDIIAKVPVPGERH